MLYKRDFLLKCAAPPLLSVVRAGETLLPSAERAVAGALPTAERVGTMPAITGAARGPLTGAELAKMPEHMVASSHVPAYRGIVGSKMRGAGSRLWGGVKAVGSAITHPFSPLRSGRASYLSTVARHGEKELGRIGRKEMELARVAERGGASPATRAGARARMETLQRRRAEVGGNLGEHAGELQAIDPKWAPGAAGAPHLEAAHRNAAATAERMQQEAATARQHAEGAARPHGESGHPVEAPAPTAARNSVMPVFGSTRRISPREIIAPCPAMAKSPSLGSVAMA
jgi:hypothetical protein